MKRKYTLRRIKAKKSYSTIELSRLLGVHAQTIRSWNKEGMMAIDSESHRPLFLGTIVKAFLKQQQDSRKVKLEPNQFYCLRCKSAVTPQSIKVKNRDVLVGKQQKSISLTAKCPTCDCLLNRFSTESNYSKLKNNTKKLEIEKVIKSVPPAPFNHSHGNKYK
jgi:hypothetical protein